MKSLTQTAASHCVNRYNEPVLLLEFDWSDTETGRYAERTVQFDGTIYDGAIMEAGPIECVFADPASEYRPVTVKLFASDELRRRLAGGSPEGITTRIKLSFEGTSTADSVELFSGHVGKASLVEPDHIEVELVGFFDKFDRMLPCDILTLTQFPKAHPHDVGAPFPIVFGDVPTIPTLRVRTGAATNLHGSILYSDTTLVVDDTEGFPSSGTLLIEEEQIAYAGIAGRMFIGCTRGVNDTEAVDHLNRREVIEYMSEHIYLAAGHACKEITDVRVAGAPVDEGACTIDCNNTILVPGLSVATITFVNRPKAIRHSPASRFLEMQFDETAPENEADNPQYCFDTTLEGFATLVAMISGVPDNDTLRIRQTTDVTGYGDKYGEILKAFLMVEHFESKTFDDDYLTVHFDGQTVILSKPGEEDTAGGGGEIDIDHTHSHSVTGEHTHEMTVKKEPVFTNHIVQIGGTTGGWSELDDIAGQNLNKSGFTVTPATDKSLQCFIASTTSKGSIERIQFCCRHGESGMAGSFYLRFYLNGNLEKTYQISGAYSPTTWKSGWETIEGLTWDDLDNANTYVLITPDPGNQQNIRLFGAWYELEYLEQPDTYEGTGVKDSADVDAYAGDNAHVINEEPVSSTSVVEGIDITSLVSGNWEWFNNREVQVNYSVVDSDDGVMGYLLHLWFEIEYAPFEEVVSDEVTCAVRGIETGGDGTGELIENPADVIEHIIVEFLGLNAADYVDENSFAAARENLENAAASFAFALRERMKASTLLDALARQARCRLKFDSGRFHLVYHYGSYSESCRSIAPSSLYPCSSGTRHTGLKGISNRVIAHYSRDYTRHGNLAERYTAVAIAEDAQSQTVYGTRESRLELFAVRDAAYAGNLADFHVSRRSGPIRRYSWKSFLRDIDLERGDVVEICDLRADLLKVRGELLTVSFLPGSGMKRRLDAIAFDAELEPFDLYWSVDGGTYVRIVGGEFYFVVKRELVARLSRDGIFHIRGFVVGDQALPSATGSPLTWDADRETIAFSLTDNTRVMELDGAGNVLLPAQEETDQGILAPGGTADSIESDGSALWFNSGPVKVAEVTAAGLLRLLGHIVENCNWEQLYG